MEVMVATADFKASSLIALVFYDDAECIQAKLHSVCGCMYLESQTL